MSKHNFSYDFLVFIGRFQPFHKGHQLIVNESLKLANKLIILCGSAYQPRSIRNPWFFKERERMIRGAFAENDNKRLLILPLMDIPYNDDLWVKKVEGLVSGIVNTHHQGLHANPKIGLIGYSKDKTSYYLGLFPKWSSEEVKNYRNINATLVREKIFSNSTEIKAIQEIIPDNVYSDIKYFITSAVFLPLLEEYNFVKQYKKSWEASPYPPILVTVDALVTHSKHVLLIKRKTHPAKGSWALPGGFIQPEETLLEACLRELQEETKLDIPTKVLKEAVHKTKVFDDPNRSVRGRTITHVFHIKLESTDTLPDIIGSDDAEEAVWRPLIELDSINMCEDHYFVIHDMLAMVD